MDHPEQEKSEKDLCIMNENLCTVQNLATGYRLPRRPTHVVTQGLELSLSSGELTCLIGPNGSGKSTLLRTIAGMQPPIEGKILLRGKELKLYSQRELSRYLSVVLTDRVDVGFLSSYALVALGRHPYTGWSGRITSEDDAVVRWALNAVGADELTHRYVTELSDGERQKIMIARALAQEPQLMLLDEPTAFLDVLRRVEIMQLLRKLARETGKSIFMSTHDLELAIRSADRICLLSMGGRLQTGIPEDLVLRGAFEETFHSEGVLFDRERGHFTITEKRETGVFLEGRGIGFQWTRRALEREGYVVTESKRGAGAVVRVLGGGKGLHWKSTAGERECAHHTLEEVLARLKGDLKQGPSE